MSSPSLARQTREASIASAVPVRARSMPARFPSLPSTGAMSVLATSWATGTCLPCPPRHTWARTAPLVSGASPSRRSRLTRARTSRFPRSAATNAPASKISITRLPSARSQPCRSARSCRPGRRSPVPASSDGGVHLLFGDLTMLGLVGRDEIVNSAKPAVVVELQAQSVVHPGARRFRHAGSHGGMNCGDEICVDSHGQAALCSHTESVHLSHSNGMTALPPGR